MNDDVGGERSRSFRNHLAISIERTRPPTVRPAATRPRSRTILRDIYIYCRHVTTSLGDINLCAKERRKREEKAKTEKGGEVRERRSVRAGRFGTEDATGTGHRVDAEEQNVMSSVTAT